VNVCENGSNGNCSQLCVHDAHKEYHCDCEDGYQLDTDYRSCVCKYFCFDTVSALNLFESVWKLVTH